MSIQAKFSQFIYGKFSEGNSGYCLVACTPDLVNEKQYLKEIAEKKYYFGNPQDGKSRKAVGIYYPWSNDQLLLIKTTKAVSEENELLGSGGSEFYQYHYIIVPKEELATINNQIISLLLKLNKDWIPYFKSFNTPGYLPSNSETSWWDLKFDFFKSPVDDSNQARNEKIKRCLQETDSQGKPFLQLVLAAILNQKQNQQQVTSEAAQKAQLILTVDGNVTNPISFSEYLLLMLPASYRAKIAIAIGSVDEEKCSWADLIIKKKNSFPKHPLPAQCIWFNRESKKIIGNYNQDMFAHPYVDDFIVPISNQPEAIIRFMQFLDSLTEKDFTSNNFIDPERLIYFIPKLPEAQQNNLWDKYIPKVSPHNWKNIIDDFINNIGFEDAINRLSLLNQNSVDLTRHTRLISIVINKRYPELNYQRLLESIKENQALSYNLIHGDLLEAFKAESKDTEKGRIIVEICHQGIKYNIQDNSREFTHCISKCREYKQFFPLHGINEFLLLDASVLEGLELEVFKVRFNQDLAYRLAYLKQEEIIDINQLNLFRYLNQNLSNIAELVSLLLEQRNNGLVNLAAIANEMEMTPSQKDLTYSRFLENWSPTYENARSLLIDIVENSIQNSFNNPENAFDKIAQKITKQIAPEQYFNRNIFAKTFQWFEENNSNLAQILNSIEQSFKNWQNWHKFATHLYDDQIGQITFLEKTVGNLFPINLLKRWLLFLEDNPAYENDFFQSHSWSNLQARTAIDLFQSEIKWAKTIVQYAIADNHLEIISGDFLHYLKHAYLEVDNISQEDKQLWINLTTPTTLSSLNNNDWLNLWLMSCKIGMKADFPSPRQPLNEIQQENFYRIAEELLNSTSKFPERLSLLNYYSSYQLDSEKTKKLAIILIKTCSTSQEVGNLMESCENFDFSSSQEKTILKNIDPKLYTQVYDQYLLNLLDKYLTSNYKDDQLEEDWQLIEILFYFPVSNQEEKRKIGSILNKHWCQRNNPEFNKKLLAKIIEKYYFC